MNIQDKSSELMSKARTYLETLCGVKPNRRTGSPGNKQAVDFFAREVSLYAEEIDTTPFETLDYICSQVQLSDKNTAFASFRGLVPGPPWFMGDHMIFVQKGIPALAFASENMEEFMQTAAHTSMDTPDIVDYRLIIEAAQSIHDFIRSL